MSDNAHKSCRLLDDALELLATVTDINGRKHEYVTRFEWSGWVRWYADGQLVAWMDPDQPGAIQGHKDKIRAELARLSAEGKTAESDETL